MTEEERQKEILRHLGQLGTIGYHDPDVACKWILDGHDEIRRLIAKNKQLVKTVEQLKDIIQQMNDDLMAQKNND